jgi:hypothetical protein
MLALLRHVLLETAHVGIFHNNKNVRCVPLFKEEKSHEVICVDKLYTSFCSCGVVVREYEIMCVCVCVCVCVFYLNVYPGDNVDMTKLLQN